MSIPSNAVPESSFESQAMAPAAVAETRPMYWSVRRELWENRSIYIAPLAVAGVYLLGYWISLIRLPHNIREYASLGPADKQVMLAMPYTHAAMLLALIAFLVGAFYCLDALHGERRDRSILFWKSLPVSDRTAVLSKAMIPLVVLPVLTFVLIVVLQVVMLLLSTVVLLMSGGNAATLWTGLPWIQMELVLLYSLTVIALWHAPIYAWLLLVSGWARRATFLWAVLPPLLISMFESIAFHLFEKMGFHSSYFSALLTNRLFGWAPEAFDYTMPDGRQVDMHFIPVTQIALGKFLSSPGLWVGLAFAAGFLALAVRLRRDREPM
jgi:ABC-2 type transport system permease protein